MLQSGKGPKQIYKREPEKKIYKMKNEGNEVQTEMKY